MRDLGIEQSSTRLERTMSFSTA